ncbi:MAG: hypothetical protein ACLP8S_12020 [Solirubrobacteraceae bacterium]
MAILTVVVLLVGWLISQVISYRRLRRERRAQQKWVISGAAISLVALLIQITNSPIAVVVSVGISALPVAMGIGILKYRLYEIDRIVTRTPSYTILAALLAGTFVGLVALTTDLLPFSSSVGVAASTLAAAALFNPLRKRVQRAVDQRFNRARYDGEQTVAEFAAQLRDAVDLDTIQGELLQVVHQAVEPTHATIWIRHGTGQPLGGSPLR